ncbi:MAG: ATP-binding protein [Clostridiales bacterium]|jgi:serine/threonine-protein kinase RsbW|nr:ATP-binding protein [Eubacteriales bacterium]MDH7566335.1 ATP-binding protein [Clostridiales bacterium]
MKCESVELVLPFKAEYVSIARLTASGVASRVGFDIDTIEDIKVSISEVCNKLVSTGSQSAENYRIVFKVSDTALNVTFQCEDHSLKSVFDQNGDELGISIITALMDDIEFCGCGSNLLSMSKKLEGNI